jgi:hypothetical protein
MTTLKWLDDEKDKSWQERVEEREKDKSYQEKLEEQTAYYRLIEKETDNVPDEVMKSFCKPWDRFRNECRKSIPDGYVDENDSRREYPYFNLYLSIFIRMMQWGEDEGKGVW